MNITDRAIPKKVIVDRSQQKVFVDGEQFPYFIAEDGIQIDHLATDGPVLITVTFLAEDAEVIPKGEQA